MSIATHRQLAKEYASLARAELFKAQNTRGPRQEKYHYTAMHFRIKAQAHLALMEDAIEARAREKVA